jgi:hypothetical protein
VLEESTGLVYFGARWYDPEVGRFISVDPAEDGENWYEYCEGNPINYIDPDGQKIWFIHGTNCDRNFWYRFSSFTAEIVHWFYGETPDFSFDWGTNNNDDDSRQAAAQRLASKIRAWSISHPGMSPKIVTHSHGGNVAILAANILGDPRNGAPVYIENLITVSLPVRDDYRLEFNNVLVHNNVYHIGDGVQINAGYNKVTKFPNWARTYQVLWWKVDIKKLAISMFPKTGDGGPGEYGQARRPYPGANNIPVNTRRSGPIPEIEAHAAIMADVDEWRRQVQPYLQRWYWN